MGGLVHRQNPVVKSCIAFLDRAPLIPGHSLVIPRGHFETLDDVDEALLAPLFAVARQVSRAQQRALGADGTFTAINTRVSQSVPHAHVHVVPRREGDGLFRARAGLTAAGTSARSLTRWAKDLARGSRWRMSAVRATSS